MLLRQYLVNWKKLGSLHPNTCIISCKCIEMTDKDPLHEVMSKELDARFRWYVTYINDTELFTKLVVDDLIPLEGKYQNHCSLTYRNCVRSQLRKNDPAVSQNKHQAFFQLASELEMHSYNTNDTPFLLTYVKKR